VNLCLTDGCFDHSEDGTFRQHDLTSVIRRHPTDADGARHVATFGGNVNRCYFLTEPVERFENARLSVSVVVLAKQVELISVRANRDRAAHVVFECTKTLGNFLQKTVRNFVGELIVDPLEVVDLDERTPEALRAFDR
jgi:hypothetical protein